MAAKFNKGDVMLDNADDAVGGRSGKKCDPCGHQKRPSLADQFCKTCSEFLCSDYCESHTIYKAGDHDIGLASEAESVKKVVDMKGLDRCLEHKKLFVFFCEDHDDLCCEICALAYHRKCDNLQEVAKLVQEGNSDMLTLNKEFERAKEQAIKKMTDTTNKEEIRQESRQLEANLAKGSLDMTRSFFVVVNKDGSATEKFIMKQVLKKRLQESRRVIEGLLQDDHAVYMNLVWNETVKCLLSLKENICHLVVRYDEQYVDELLSINKYAGTDKQPFPCTPVRLEVTTTMRIADEEPFITGLDFLPDGMIVAVNNNRKCFVMSDTLQKLDVNYTFKALPRDVTCYSDNNIAITISSGDVRAICLLKVCNGNTITLMKTLTISTYCFSICPLNDRTFVVSTWNDPRPARMIDMDGKVSDFNNVQFPEKTYMINESRGTYIPSINTVVLTARYANTVYLYNTVTGMETELKDRRIREPRDACVGPDGSIFVCSQKSNSIVQISPSGDILTSLNVDMRGPYTVAVSRDGSRMIVSNSLSGSMKLKLFNLIK
ncbi:uncharacterized protein LOC128219322 [Mya arenaria]|uniref:uncharacterized protein LOC128219322 n=1 Tax=Mya arenaria TaxID=6604 RepID=UPI0022E322D2|nr:uncharacterized protein LOC128219322 [Mya arenaria]